ncbi:hypothetical protein [Ramlibacter sp. AN1133]|uniref:hypothetical protein n=1 Tax=Ramlibacter sp. AN1133 TaxID=3133429 RepID=UPI0030BE9E8D
MRTPTPRESLLLALGAALLLAALFGPHVAQPAHYHAFADQRSLWGVPHALDVLSNLPFALAGIAGLRLLRGDAGLAMAPVQRGCAALFFGGLVLTTVCSAWYHLQPQDAGLAIDRAGMSLAFAGALGLLAATQVSDRAGRMLALAVLVAAPLAIMVCLVTGNVLPWALLQGGGLLLFVVFGLRAPRTGALHVRWVAVLAIYVIAKLLEVGDHAVFEASGQLLSGHTLKHLVAAFAAWPLLSAIAALRRGQNPASSVATVRA